MFQAIGKVLLMCLCVVGSVHLHAQTAIIANPAISDENLSKEQIVEIFLGKVKQLPSGKDVTPYDQEQGSEARTEFYELAVKKNEKQLKAYWVRLIFTGKGAPPEGLKDNDEVLERRKLFTNNSKFFDIFVRTAGNQFKSIWMLTNNIQRACANRACSTQDNYAFFTAHNTATIRA